MMHTAAQPGYTRDIPHIVFPTDHGTARRPGPPSKDRQPGNAPETAGMGNTLRLFLTPEDTTMPSPHRPGTRFMTQPPHGVERLKALFWIAAAIGLSLGIAGL
jgi:hypothetical protein